MIKDLTELQKLLKLCRKQGITEIKLGDISIRFGDIAKSDTEREEASEEKDILDSELTAEQLMYFSVSGEPMP